MGMMCVSPPRARRGKGFNRRIAGDRLAVRGRLLGLFDFGEKAQVRETVMIMHSKGSTL
jgi:hypothetical protein